MLFIRNDISEKVVSTDDRPIEKFMWSWILESKTDYWIVSIIV